MKHRLFAHRSFVESAFRPMAKVLNLSRKAGPVAVLCLTVLTLGVVCLSEVYGALRTTARSQETAASSTPTFTIIDAPGAGTGALQGTFGVSINAGGDIAGIYLTAPNVAHGFVRAANGTITTFNASGAGISLNQGTFPVSINTAGDIAGMYFDTNNAYHGFVRTANGTITQFDVPGAPTTLGHRGTIPISIDTAGDITGFYVDANDVRHGFVRAANGTVTSFNVAGAGTGALRGTVPLGIDTAGDITGFYVDASGTFHGFVRAANGTITAPIDAPGAGTGAGGNISFKGTLPASIDAAGDIAGVYADTNSVYHGFVRAANGTITAPIDAPSAGNTGLIPGTVPLSINAGGDLSGIYTDTNGVRHGFMRAANGTITAPIDAPGASTTGMFSGTILTSINTTGQMTGAFADTNNVFHGFLLSLGTSTPPAATPTFNPPAGTYTSVQTVSISDTTAGATIYFTTDGTTPTTASTVFTTPITINSTKTIKAIAAASGFSNSAVATATYTINLPAPDFQVSVNPTTLTIVAGQSGQATFTVTPVNGFNSAVTFACSGLPSEAACNFNPPSVTPNGAAISSTLTVTTTAPSAAMRMPFSQRPIYAFLFPGLAMMLGIAARRKPALRRARLFGLLILLVLATGLTSCSGSKPAGNPGTPVGTQSVSVSAATSSVGGTNHAANLTITITH